MMSYNTASARDVVSLQNWIDGTSCLSREETAYLDHDQELISLASISDNAVEKLENWVEDQLIRFYQGSRAV